MEELNLSTIPTFDLQGPDERTGRDPVCSGVTDASVQKLPIYCACVGQGFVISQITRICVLVMCIMISQLRALPQQL